MLSHNFARMGAIPADFFQCDRCGACVEKRDNARGLRRKTIVRTLSFLSLSEMGERQCCRRWRYGKRGPTFQCVSHDDAALTVIFSWSGENHRPCWRYLGSAQFVSEAPNALVATPDSVVGDQILPDGHGIAISTQTQLNDL